MRTSLLRERRASDGSPVTHMELFFDVVYVFAFIQLSHHLLEHLTARGAVETVVLFLGVWWAWNYTTWAMNWLDPDKAPVRALMLVLMLLSLVMSAAIPDAFGGRALAFAAAYVSLQVLRSAFMILAFGRQRMARNFAQLLAWSVIAGAWWIAGAFAEGNTRLLLWIIAIVIDYAAPLHGFALPRMGRTHMRDWTLAGAHLAERGQLVIIIALGESILEIGLTLGKIPWSMPVTGAFLVGFLMTVSLWWMYFIRYAEESVRTIARADDPARLGRAGYAYGHAIMVLGIIGIAVAIAKMIAHPSGPMSVGGASMMLAGPAVYLAGNALFNYTVSGRLPWSRLIGIALMMLLAPLAPVVTPLTLGTAVAFMTLVLALATGTPRPPPTSDRVAASAGEPV